MNSMQSSWRGILAGIGYSTIFGFSFIMTKNALEILSPMELLALRFCIAAILMTILVGLRVLHVDYRHKPLQLLVLMCLFQPVAYFICETYGVANAATNMAGIILGAVPAGVALLDVLVLKERLQRFQWVGLVMSIVGVILVTLLGQGESAETRPIGVLFLIGAMLSAVFSIS